MTLDAEANACETLGCPARHEPIAYCKDHRCPWRWQRESREDRARRDEKDRQAKEAEA